MKAIIWDGEAFDAYSKEEMLIRTNGITKNVPLVIDENGHLIILQPLNSSQSGPWETKEEALAWGNRFITSSFSVSPKVQNS
jgi:hypothetical protein